MEDDNKILFGGLLAVIIIFSLTIYLRSGAF